MMHERLDRRLSLLAAVPLEIHLDGCQTCRSELAALSGATRAVRAVASVEAPARVREQVLSAYRRQSRRALGSPRWRPAVAVAFAALAVGAVTLMRPSVTPLTDRRVAQTTEPAAGLPSQSLTIAAVPPTSAGDAQEQAIPEAGQTAAQAPLNSGREQFSRRMTAMPAKGPTPGIVASEADSPRVGLPAALRALRAVAKSASPDWEVQRAMETAGERFATLDSEAMSESMLAAALPSATSGGSSSDGEDSKDTPAPVTGDTGPAQDNGGGQSNEPSAPVREGASLNVGPFV
jgi:hypothetical protein